MIYCAFVYNEVVSIGDSVAVTFKLIIDVISGVLEVAIEYQTSMKVDSI